MRIIKLFLMVPEYFKPLDVVILILSVGVFSFSLFLAVSSAAPGAVIQISGEEGEYAYDLNIDGEIEIPGPLGSSVVHVHEGSVSMHSSPCTEKLCIAMGEIRREGSWIACLPNKVFIRIVGESEGEVDATAY
ncbi:MAG: NusG domain II-containing protein [Spirochaetia bacterium]